MATHIHRRRQRERDAQLLAVAEMFLSLGEPAILLGDLNCPAGEPPLRELLQMPGVTDAIGEIVRGRGGWDPPGRVDWIITRGLRPVDGGIVDKGASDHPLVWVELEGP
jgi:endonuclease/exonuclease/phosphatase family metal-dependent hydrolase